MNINGIIAEYNPFHNGHKYHLETSKKLTDANYTIVVMSGNFVQRGAPALQDKYTRTKSALMNGADLVLELPALCACSSAEYFAAGAVSLLEKLGVVTHLCFGSECGNVEELEQIAYFLLTESTEYRTVLTDYLQQGLNYPAARTKTLSFFLSNNNNANTLLASPNNTLGIEYIRQLRRLNSKIRPFTIQRIGAGYHDMADSQFDMPKMPSALGIRSILARNSKLSSIKSCVPPDVMDAIFYMSAENKLLFSNDISPLLHYKLLSDSGVGYERYQDISSALSDRIIKTLDLFSDFESYCGILKTKELTYTHISRGLLHILLNITKEDMKHCQDLGYAPYAKVLGFRRNSTQLLSMIKQSSSIPLLTKLADAKKILDQPSYSLLQKEILISRLYQGIVTGKSGHISKNEYTITPVIL